MKEWDQNRDVTHADQLRTILKSASDCPVNVEDKGLQELSEAYVSPLNEIPPYLDPDAFLILERLKQQKKKIGLICNTGLTPGFGLRSFLSRQGVARYFDLMIFSDEIGIRKPDSKIFRLAACKLRTKPQQIVHVGDNLKTDVWGAKNAGFKAIHLSENEGRDHLAEKDPKSLALLSRSLGKLEGKQMPPDKAITTLATVTEAIKEIENQAVCSKL